MSPSPPAKFRCWNPKPHCDGIRRWGLWEVMRSWVWNPSWVRLVPLHATEIQESSLLHSAMQWCRENSTVNQEVGSHQTQSYQCLDLRLPSLQNCGNKTVVHKTPSLWCFFIAAQPKKISRFTHFFLCGEDGRKCDSITDSKFECTGWGKCWDTPVRAGDFRLAAVLRPAIISIIIIITIIGLLEV